MEFIFKSDKFKATKKILMKTFIGRCLTRREVANQKCFHLPPSNIFYLSLILNSDSLNNFTNLYEKYFKIEEMQNMILESNGILPYVVTINHPKTFLNFVIYLSELFKENHYMLYHLLLKNVTPTNQSTFMFFEDYENRYVVHNIRSLIFLLLR